MIFKFLSAIFLIGLLSSCSVNIGTSSTSGYNIDYNIDYSNECSSLGDYNECLVNTCYADISYIYPNSDTMQLVHFNTYSIKKSNHLINANIYYNNKMINPKIKLNKTEALVYLNNYVLTIKERYNKVTATFNNVDSNIVCVETFFESKT
jgi:hypothetical protein